MKDAYVDFVRELRGTVRARRQEKIREVELSWSASELAGFRVFVQGLHPNEMSDICFALSDAQAIPLLDILGDFAGKDPDLRKLAFQSMEKTSCLARIYLAQRLFGSKNPEVRASVCKMLGSAGSRGEELLARALADDNRNVQIAAVDAVAHGGFKKLGSTIFSLLREEDANLRYAALSAVTRLGCQPPHFSSDLEAILLDSTQEERTRRLAAGVLARSASRKARSIFLDALGNPQAEYILKIAAAESLCAYDDPESIKAVLLAGDDCDEKISKTARMALSRKHSQNFANSLEKLIKDKDVSVAVLAAEILGGLETSRVGDMLLASLEEERRPPVIGALAEAIGKSAVSGAWEALIHKQQNDRFFSRQFISALADVADEDNLKDFASLFYQANEDDIKLAIMERLALFSRAAPVAPEIKELAIRTLAGSKEVFHLPAASILANIQNLEPEYIKLTIERLCRLPEDSSTERVALCLLRNNSGAVGDVFCDAPLPQPDLSQKWLPRQCALGWIRKHSLAKSPTGPE